MFTWTENRNWMGLVALESQVGNEFLVLSHSLSQSSRHNVDSKIAEEFSPFWIDYYGFGRADFLWTEVSGTLNVVLEDVESL